MDNNDVINERIQKFEKVKVLLNSIDEKLLILTKDLNWDYKKLLKEKPSNMVTCSINLQHKVPISKLEMHEQKCSWHQQGYKDDDKIFPDCSGAGSFVTLTAEMLHSITKTVADNNCVRAVPQTSAKFDQNFSREEKLAIYNYVIANTEKQKSYSDLWLQATEKTNEKKEMAAWEIAAAERDAKRRRASYRNKVHTNRKSHTEILREVIEAQMQAFQEEIVAENKSKKQKHESSYRKHSSDSKESTDKRRHEFPGRRNEKNGEKSRNSDKHSERRERKRSPSDCGSDNKSRSRSHDKYRKWKSYEGRSHSHRSSHPHRRK